MHNPTESKVIESLQAQNLYFRKTIADFVNKNVSESAKYVIIEKAGLALETSKRSVQKTDSQKNERLVSENQRLKERIEHLEKICNANSTSIRQYKERNERLVKQVEELEMSSVSRSEQEKKDAIIKALRDNLASLRKENHGNRQRYETWKEKYVTLSNAMTRKEINGIIHTAEPKMPEVPKIQLAGKKNARD